MMHTAWRSTEEVPYCFTRTSIKFQGHTGKTRQFLHELTVSGLDVVQKSCLIVFRCHSSNFKVTQVDDLNPIWVRSNHQTNGNVPDNFCNDLKPNSPIPHFPYYWLSHEWIRRFTGVIRHVIIRVTMITLTNPYYRVEAVFTFVNVDTFSNCRLPLTNLATTVDKNINAEHS